MPSFAHATARSASSDESRRAGLLPSATFFLIVLFSLVVLERPPTFPDDPQRRAPIASIAHYSFADLVPASR